MMTTFENTCDICGKTIPGLVYYYTNGIMCEDCKNKTVEKIINAPSKEIGIPGKLDNTINVVLNNPLAYGFPPHDPNKAKEKGGTKYDKDKLRMDLLPPEAIEEIAKVLTFGAKKYDSWNWTKGISYSRLIAATLRHIYAWLRGETIDPESGLNHLSHAACNLCFLLWFTKHRPDLDDRYKNGKE